MATLRSLRHGYLIAVRDVLLPTTDAGAAAQLVVALLVLAAVGSRVRHRPELRLVLIGLALVVFGAAGLRAVH